MRVQQPSLLEPDVPASPPPLLLLACSATKLDQAAPAIELYRGVMYETFRAHRRPDSQLHVIILSALHGFIDADAHIAPYDLRMTHGRATSMLEDLHVAMASATWPARFGQVFLAGGEQYRRVMRAAVTNRSSAQQPTDLIETRGGIGEQRSQLGKFLRNIALEPSERIGVLPNGTPCYRRAGRFVVGDRVRLSYSHLPGVPDKLATIRRIFAGPCGLTAEADVEEPTRGGGITVVGRWVCLHHLQPA